MTSMPAFYLGTSLPPDVGGAHVFLPSIHTTAVVGASYSVPISASWLVAVALQSVCIYGTYLT